MCTVSFVPVKGGALITSSRDEKKTRSIAVPPQFYAAGKGRLFYPKDPDKGGTWMAVKENGATGVLLNGAEKDHVPQPPYGQSRGLVLTQVMAATDPLNQFDTISLLATEPFTIVLYFRQQLFTCRWDGSEKKVIQLDARQPHIWSSCTLYTPEVIRKRAGWFTSWLAKNPEPTQEAVLGFHQFAGDGDTTDSICMNRAGQTFTVSITSIALTQQHARVQYHDLIRGEQYRQSIALNTSSLGQEVQAYLRRLRIRLRHWEYWPFHVVYFPIFFYWFWLCIKARSLFYFNAANPTIRNGGFLMESKKEIYDLLPPGTYPKTLYCPKGTAFAKVQQQVQQNELSFPLIAKPDIGLRGMGVSLLHSVAELATYHAQSKVDFLVQAYVPYTQEVGIFYYRLPGQARGHITSMVAKELLTVTGDGNRPVRELLEAEDRAFLQLPALEQKHGAALSRVLPAGKEWTVVPFGNHCRGAKFIDCTHLLDQALLHTIDGICRQVKGFYFGRLDIRFHSWNDLRQGRNFSIIELNGAGSEPAHIYDPRHTIFFGWKEIIRHLQLLYQVSVRNKTMHDAAYLSFTEGLQMFRDNSEHVRKLSQPQEDEMRVPAGVATGEIALPVHQL